VVCLDAREECVGEVLSFLKILLLEFVLRFFFVLHFCALFFLCVVFFFLGFVFFVVDDVVYFFLL